MKVDGVSIQISTDELAKEKGLWWDSDYYSDIGKKGFGIVFALRFGRWFEPFGLFCGNRWKDGRHWFVIPKILFVYPFISIAIGNYGLYLGWKAYGVEHKDYLAWAKLKDIYEGNSALSFSVSIRKTRIR